MTDCGRVDAWIEQKKFTSEEEVTQYVRAVEVRTGEPQEGTFWDCLDAHEFTSYFTIDKRGYLRRRSREEGMAGRFMATNLDIGAKNAILEFLRA